MSKSYRYDPDEDYSVARPSKKQMKQDRKDRKRNEHAYDELSKDNGTSRDFDDIGNDGYSIA